MSWSSAGQITIPATSARNYRAEILRLYNPGVEARIERVMFLSSSGPLTIEVRNEVSESCLYLATPTGNVHQVDIHFSPGCSITIYIIANPSRQESQLFYEISGRYLTTGRYYPKITMEILTLNLPVPENPMTINDLLQIVSTLPAAALFGPGNSTSQQPRTEPTTKELVELRDPQPIPAAETEKLKLPIDNRVRGAVERIEAKGEKNEDDTEPKSKQT